MKSISCIHSFSVEIIFFSSLTNVNKMRKLCYIFILSLIFVACTDKKPAEPQSQASSVADSVQIGIDYDSLVASEARAAVDTAFKASEEYKAAHEAYQKRLSEITEGQDEQDRLLAELELAAKALHNNGRKLTSNIEQMRDPVNQHRMRIYVDKIKSIQKQLSDYALADDQQVRLDSLVKTLPFS